MAERVGFQKAILHNPCYFNQIPNKPLPINQFCAYKLSVRGSQYYY
jgi:hypothetical protein